MRVPSPSLARIVGRIVLALAVFGILAELSWELGDRIAGRLGLRADETASTADTGARARGLAVHRIATAREKLAQDPAQGEAMLVAMYRQSVDPALRARIGVILVNHAASSWPQDSRGAFLRAIAPAALHAGRTHRIPPSITLAQAALESGWGRSRLARLHHNLFGVKATGSQQAVVFPTQEQTPQGVRILRARFRTFENDAASLAHHANLLSSDPRYAAAKETNDWQGYLSAIAPTYATDTAYARRVGTIIRRHRLDRWDALMLARPQADSQS